MDYKSSASDCLVGRYNYKWLRSLLPDQHKVVLSCGKIDLQFINSCTKVAIYINEVSQAFDAKGNKLSSLYEEISKHRKVDDEWYMCATPWSNTSYFGPYNHNKFSRKYRRLVSYEHLTLVVPCPKWQMSDRVAWTVSNNQWCAGYIVGICEGKDDHGYKCLERLVCYEVKRNNMRKRFFNIEYSTGRMLRNVGVKKMPQYWLDHIISDYSNHNIYCEATGFENLLNRQFVMELENKKPGVIEMNLVS